MPKEKIEDLQGTETPTAEAEPAVEPAITNLEDRPRPTPTQDIPIIGEADKVEAKKDSAVELSDEEQKEAVEAVGRQAFLAFHSVNAAVEILQGFAPEIEASMLVGNPNTYILSSRIHEEAAKDLRMDILPEGSTDDPEEGADGTGDTGTTEGSSEDKDEEGA